MTIKCDLPDRLTSLLDELAASTPVTDTDFDPDRLSTVTVEPGRRSLVPALTSAAVVAGAVAGGLFLMANRAEPSGATSPTDTPPATPGLASDPVARAVTFDPPPAGFRLTSAATDAFANAEWPIQTRFYTADPDRPETASTFAVTVMPDHYSADVPADATSATVQGVPGSLYDERAGGRTLAFSRDGQAYTVTGYRVTDAEILMVAEHTSPAGAEYDYFGAVVDPAGLPVGVEEIDLGGSWLGNSFIGKNALTHPVPATQWESDTATLSTVSLEQSPRWLPLARLGWDTVTDTTVHGQPAFIVAAASDPDYRGVNWSEDGITYMVSSSGLNDTELLDIVEQLRAATSTEWREMVATSNSDPSPHSGLIDAVRHDHCGTQSPRPNGNTVCGLSANPAWPASSPMKPTEPRDDSQENDLLASLRVVWLDAPSGRRSFPLDHRYVELVYTPLVGASAVLFLRRIALLLDLDAEVDVDPIVMARELGMRSQDDRPLGRNSSFMKAMHRLEYHQLARWLGPRRLGVYRQAPALADVHLPNLPESARRIHLRYIQTQ